MSLKPSIMNSDNIVPCLSSLLHKGVCGRIAVIGGSQEYTGAPYFAAMGAILTGADICHVFTTNEAATVIKGYSPDLIVHPVLRNQGSDEEAKEAVGLMMTWLDRVDAEIHY